MAIARGDRAPVVTLLDEEGRPVAVPAGDGPLVLVFYRGDW